MLKNMKIGKKLILSFICVAILASASGIFSIFVIRNMDTEYSRALVDYGFSQGDIGKAMVEVSNGNRCARDIIGFTVQSDINAAQAELEQVNQRYTSYLAAVEARLVTPEEEAQYAAIRAAESAYTAKRTEVINLGNTQDPEVSRRAQQMAVNELDPLYNAFYAAWSGLMDMNVNTGNALSTELSQQATVSLLTSIAVAVVAIVVSIVLGTLIARGISNPINQCVTRLVQLEKGDLKTPVPEPTSSDETGVLLGALKNTVDMMSAIITDVDYLLSRMAGGDFSVHTRAEDKYIGGFAQLLVSMRKLRVDMISTLTQIDQAADQVSSGSEQVSSGAQALSQGATEQASSVEELAATINEISAQVKGTAVNADEARKQTGFTGDEVSVCNQQMQDMIGAMGEISESSAQIGKIIKTIEDIAFQTNILALNAAVEAARAGAAGKGFAVVADEVRSLASKSAEASKNTSALIEGSGIAVEKGMSIADQTAASLARVVEATKGVMAIVDKISAAANEQATSIAQVTQGVDQISSVVQTNSATAEESAAASEELTGQAQMLKELIKQFTLDETAVQTTAAKAATAPSATRVPLTASDKY